MITTLAFSKWRAAVMLSWFVFLLFVAGLTAQQDNRRDMGTRVEIAAEKINSLEEWRRAIEGTNISPRLATLESQMETATWQQRAMLGGIGVLILEMFVRLLTKSKKE